MEASALQIFSCDKSLPRGGQTVKPQTHALTRALSVSRSLTFDLIQSKSSRIMAAASSELAFSAPIKSRSLSRGACSRAIPSTCRRSVSLNSHPSPVEPGIKKPLTNGEICRKCAAIRDASIAPERS